VTLGFTFSLFLGIAKVAEMLIGAGGGSLGGSDRVFSEDSPSPSKDSVWSEEPGSPRGVTSLSNIILCVPKEAVKDAEEAMCAYL